MELGTFGAVMAFASQLTTQLAEFCEAASLAATGTELKTVLQSLSTEAKRDGTAMEQARRENVTEMILEPIAGLSQEPYLVAPAALTPGADHEILKMALVFVDRDQKFFQAAASRLPLPEVARALRRVAQRREKDLLRLRTLAGSA